MTKPARKAVQKDGPLVRAAGFSPGSADVEARTVDLVWSAMATGDVVRYDWATGVRYIERLSLAEGHVRLARLNNGAPFLNAHQSYDLRAQIGVVESASVDGREGRARVRLSRRDDVSAIWQDILDGIYRGVSVGYVVHRYREDGQDPATGLPIRLAIDWEPMEISLVPVPADAGAGVREQAGYGRRADAAGGEQPDDPSEDEDADGETERAGSDDESAMADDEDGERAENDPQSEDDEMSDEQQTTGESGKKDGALGARSAASIAEIEAVALKLGLSERDTLDIAKRGLPLDAVRAAAIDLAAERQKSSRTGGGISVTRDEGTTRRDAIVDAMLHRHRPDLHKLEGAAVEYRGVGLRDLARECVEMTGTRTRGMSITEIVQRATHSTSDFPLLLGTVVRRTLRSAYEETPRTFPIWCRRGTLTDYRATKRVQLSGAPDFEELLENEEYGEGSLSETAETLQLAKYGKIIRVSREMIINDDLSGFLRLPSLIGAAASRKESDVVYGLLNTASGVGPTMSDGDALFSSAHANYVTPGAAPDITTIGVARTLMRDQTGLAGEKLNLEARFLIVPSALETVALQLTSPQYVPTQQSNINPWQSRLQAIVESRIADTNSWILAADYNQVDTIEYGYLEGNEGVYLEQEQEFRTDGLAWKARLEFFAAVIDHRGMVRNAGG